jgi:starch-binding outer membrane protein, SusD/RagB family
MISYIAARSGRSRIRIAATAASVALALASCNVTETLEVRDPDIIIPGDVQSAAGASAMRLGALARLNAATSGGTFNGTSFVTEGFLLLSGLFADEWNNGDSFIARQEIDQRTITMQNNFLTDANRGLHRARLSAEQAIDLMAEFIPTAPAAQVAEMHFVQAYVVNLMAENYCSGLVFSRLVDGVEEYGTQITTTAAFEKALGHANDGLALITGTTAADLRVKYALQVTRGRILTNLNRQAEAATAVAGVPSSFKYEMLHSQTVTRNQVYELNNLNRRYSVSTGEGTNGLNFATAGDPRVPVCTGGDAVCRAAGVTQNRRDDLSASPFLVQLVWPTAETSLTLVGGIEARMIEAEAQLKAGNSSGALTTLNAARTTVSGLLPLPDAGSDVARVGQLFRERAFWLFGRGHRVGDLRRLIRQYGRAATTVFPTGAWHKGGNYGSDVTIPIPQAEENNPNVPAGKTCLDRNA